MCHLRDLIQPAAPLPVPRRGCGAGGLAQISERPKVMNRAYKSASVSYSEARLHTDPALESKKIVIHTDMPASPLGASNI
jgi:hypothetical protein